MPDQQEDAKRRAIIGACLRMNALGINQGTSGNVSLRDGDAMLITPSGLPYERMRPEDIVSMGMDGTVRGPGVPSTEWRFHLDILRSRPEVNAVVHAHPPYSTIIAILGRDIPAVHYMVAAAGGSTIRCASYATFGTEALSRHALAALDGRKACLLAHHGMIATGPSLDKALWLAVEVETLARQYHGCLQIGEPPVLDDAEIERVLGLMASYGHRDPAPAV